MCHRVPRPRTLRHVPIHQRNDGIYHLRQIDGVKYQWALEKRNPTGTPVTEAGIVPCLKGGVLPKCQTGGKYTIGKVGEFPTCSIAGHKLPKQFVGTRHANLCRTFSKLNPGATPKTELWSKVLLVTKFSVSF